MANEFIIRKGFISLADSQITGSLNVTAGITGSLLGTSSWAENAISSSYAATASLLLGSVESASYAATASIATSSSYALSASYAPGASGLTTKAGSVANSSFAGNPRKATVTFSAAFANTNYSVVITGEDSRTWTIESKAAGSFVINANSNTSLAGTTYWTAIAYGES